MGLIKKDIYNSSLEFNNFLRVSMVRSFEISQPEYQESVLIKRCYDVPDNFLFQSEQLNNKKDNLITEFRTKYESFGSFEDQLRFLCEYLQVEGNLTQDDIKYYVNDDLQLDAITLFGFDKLKAVCYKKCYVNEMLQLFKNQDPIRAELYDLLEVGKKYPAKYIKNELTRIYRANGIKKTPKATYIREYFDIQEALMNVNGVRTKCYLILNKKL